MGYGRNMIRLRNSMNGWEKWMDLVIISFETLTNLKLEEEPCDTKSSRCDIHSNDKWNEEIPTLINNWTKAAANNYYILWWSHTSFSRSLWHTIAAWIAVETNWRCYGVNLRVDSKQINGNNFFLVRVHINVVNVSR